MKARVFGSSFIARKKAPNLLVVARQGFFYILSKTLNNIKFRQAPVPIISLLDLYVDYSSLNEPNYSLEISTPFQSFLLSLYKDKKSVDWIKENDAADALSLEGVFA